MKSKLRSITTDTRLTQSGIFNNSCINQPHNNNYMSSNIQNSQNKQCDFLKIKNAQLQEKVLRMTDTINEMQKNKKQLLGINKKYVEVVNQYYRNASEGKGNSNRPKTMLVQLEKDHRNLVKHCLAMQLEIKKYTQEMTKYNEMKSQLRAVNHTSVTDLVQQIKILSAQNRHLKQQNNKVSYEYQRSKEQIKQYQKNKQQQQQLNVNNQQQLQSIKCKINTTKQQSIHHTHTYEAKIYDLELKVQKLSRDLRNVQITANQNYQQKKQLEIEKIQYVEQCTQERNNDSTQDRKNDNIQDRKSASTLDRKNDIIQDRKNDSVQDRKNGSTRDRKNHTQYAPFQKDHKYLESKVSKKNSTYKNKSYLNGLLSQSEIL